MLLTFLIHIAFQTVFQTSPAVSDKPKINAELRLEGDKGIEIFGFCVDAKGSQKREFEGRLPYQVNVDLSLQKCEVKKKDSAEKRAVNIRLFHKNELVYSNQFQNPTMGIEFVIPWK
jgi:hypothetical protein